MWCGSHRVIPGSSTKYRQDGFTRMAPCWSKRNRARLIGRLNHVAIAVRDLAAASRIYRDVLGAQISEPIPQPEHGVTTVFITLPNTKIELIAPLGAGSPIEKFLDRSPPGGIHHLC